MLQRFKDRDTLKVFPAIRRSHDIHLEAKEQIKEMKKLPGVWPERFAAKEGGVETRADDVYDDDSALARGRRKTPSDGCASSSEEDDDLPPPNRNRPPPPEQSESEEESSDEEDG